ncbi:MAG TPA: hypothetical protein VND40_06325 [Nitrososphaerales archaeon]|nr:hypothetical protein [Nitrososphaerales archaeon]
MKLLPLVEALAINAFLIPLLLLISENYGLRAAYWVSEGFTASTVRYPFFFITSAVRGTTHIQGLLSVDWQQVVLFVILVADAVFALGFYRSGRAVDRPSAPA